MDAEFEDVRKLAETRFSEAFADGPEQSFTLSLAEDLTLTIFCIPGAPPSEIIVRACVCTLEGMQQPDAFARAALEGNFFWEGTHGATLALSADNELFLTEQREMEELVTPEGLDACIQDFAEAVRDWRARRELYA